MKRTHFVSFHPLKQNQGTRDQPEEELDVLLCRDQRSPSDKGTELASWKSRQRVNEDVTVTGEHPAGHFLIIEVIE